jgi:hypothetical protein
LWLRPLWLLCPLWLRPGNKLVRISNNRNVLRVLRHLAWRVLD